LLALLAFALLAIPARAEGGQYNFGTMQGQKLVAVEPGKTAETKLYFFNVRGNRDTHVSISIDEVPPGFKVELEPPLHNATYNVSGVIVTTVENVVAPVTPKNTLPLQKPENAPPGVEYITLSGVEGFVPARVVTVKITAPADAPLWRDYKVRLSAIAGWFDIGVTGPVSVKQARDFTYDVRTVTTQFSEEIVAEQEQKPFELNAWMLATIALAVLVLLLVCYVLFSKKKKRA
ncbi:MAG: hypothetical protein QW343_03135, partial [Candidatus Norongarragalinales archaeon]